MVFIAKESIAHKTAKDTLAQWLRAAPENGNDDYWVYPIRNGDPLMWRPNWGEPVFVEYPFAADGYGACPTWDEVDWEFGEEAGPSYKSDSPTFDECVTMGHPPVFVADIALRHKGTIAAVIEVVHKHPPSDEKILFYRAQGIALYVVDAWWVLSQIAQPESLLLTEPVMIADYRQNIPVAP
jgi:hypothetical protein